MKCKQKIDFISHLTNLFVLFSFRHRNSSVACLKQKVYFNRKTRLKKLTWTWRSPVQLSLAFCFIDWTNRRRKKFINLSVTNNKHLHLFFLCKKNVWFDSRFRTHFANSLMFCIEKSTEINVDIDRFLFHFRRWPKTLWPKRKAETEKKSD